MLEIMAIRFALIRTLKYISHSCVMISTDNTRMVSYINKQEGTHTPNLCAQVWKILLWCLKHHIVVRIHHIPGKFNVLVDRLSRVDKVVKTEWALDQSIANSIFQMFNYPSLDTLQSQTDTLCIPSAGQSSLRDRCIFHELELSSCLRLSSNNADSFCPSVLYKICQFQCRIVLISPFWPQQAWFSEVLQLFILAPVCLPLFPNLLIQAKGKFQHQNLPALNLHAWELSSNQLEIRNFRKRCRFCLQIKTNINSESL